MAFSFLSEEYADLSQEDAAWQIAEHEVSDQEKEYSDKNLLGTDRDDVIQSIANDIIEAFETGQSSDPRIQLFNLKEELT